MLNTETKNFKQYVEQCADFCKAANMNTKKQVYGWLLADLMETYGNDKKLHYKIECRAKEISRAICKKMGIHK